MDTKPQEFTTTLSDKVRKVLRNPDSEGFLTIAALVFSHRNDPKTMWKDYMEPAVFFKHWPAIKDYMVDHNWGPESIPVWQAAYEKMATEAKKPAPVAGREEPVKSKEYAAIGKKLASLRSKAGMSQQALARRLMTSQQLISRIEKGEENLTFETLFKIARVLKTGVKIDLVRK